jgi:PadR family transcriptional regulator, regulatory protein AphA
MSLRYALLGLIAERPLSGYDLTKCFDQTLAHTWTARHSQIYPELARLRKAGLIELVDEGPRGRKAYAITERGLEEVRRWLAETEPDRAVRDESFLRVFFLWLMDPAKALEYVLGEAAHHRAKLAAYEEVARESAPSTPSDWSARICLEAGIRHERALLEWAEWAAEEADRIMPARRPAVAARGSR